MELANALFPSPRRELLLSSACTVVGAPAIAQLAAALLEDAGHVVKRSPNRGLDHGAWVPLRLMYSQADIPVLQLSLVHGAAAADHEKLGRALVTLRNEGVLIIGSGSLTHNVYELTRGGIDAPVPEWLADLGAWMKTMLDENQREALHESPRGAPSAQRNHPTEEHLLPLFVAMGAAGDTAKAERLHASVEYGVLAMAVYAFS